MGLVGRIGSEFAYLSGALGALAKLTRIARNPNRTFPDVAQDLVARHGDRLALISDHERMTYRQYVERGTQYTHWALGNRIQKGDVVALMMPNRPEYMAVWLGVARAGGVTALLNTNLSGQVLAHCIRVVQPKHVIVDAPLLQAFATAQRFLQTGPGLWCHGAEADGFTRIDTVVAALPRQKLPAADLPKLNNEDRCLYVYTSGTTGLPKAANINHYRVQAVMAGFSSAMKMRPSDRIYVCLPMYHTTGGVLAPGAALMAGGSVVIRDKFSAKHFWDDIVRHECTVFQYIGELCRYLLNSAPHPQETRHKIRLACGNGLRPDIWEAFQKRFRIPKILEWYASTEGNAVFFNFDGKVGAVGRIPKWAERRFSTEVVRFDIGTEQPVRGADGFCIKCEPGEVGEVISQIIVDPKRPSQRFDGYSDPAATEKKILTDVFVEGDRWFRTGDLMKKDAQGYFYFMDRIGDTFRWKGENVATSEVSEAMTVAPGVKEANVYGVRVPGSEGRAGMAAIVPGEDFDLGALYRHVSTCLPPYARPVFVRVQPAIEATSTFKQRKVELVKEGFDPRVISDPLYVLRAEQQAYVPLDGNLYDAICRGEVRL